MILEYYKLREQPFGVTPDPRFWYASDTHRGAFASLTNALESGRGFVALIAKPGMGKTTLLHHGLERLKDRAKIVFLFQSIGTPEHLLEAILTDLGVEEPRGTPMQLQAKLNYACAKHCILGKGIIVVVDEAQNMPDPVIEAVRMLSNFETEREKLIQIVLSGQPQLADKLMSPNMVQLRQRISTLASLKPLSSAETKAYIEFRLKVAGYSSDTPLFTRYALDMIAFHSEGIPRNISNLCFNAMSLGYTSRCKSIDSDIIQGVVSDLSLEPLRENSAACIRPLDREEYAPSRVPPPNRTPAPAAPPAFLEIAPAPPAKIPSDASPAIPDLTHREHRVPPLLATLKTEHSIGFKLFSREWAFRTVGASLFLLLLLMALAPGFTDFLREIHVLAAKAEVGLRSLVPADASAPAQNAQSQPAAKAEQVNFFSAREGQSLRSICVESFGRCTPQILREIRRLNPQLGHPVSIVAGQLIRVPDKSILTAPVDQANRNLPTTGSAP